MEQTANPYFINAEEIGDYAEITVTTHDGVEEDLRLHYLESGIGEPLLLVHGIGQSLYTWRNVFGELSESYRVIAVDLPGHGYSSRPEHFAYSMDEMANALHAFLGAMGITCTHAMGFSTGAGYLFRMLSLYPDDLANFVALCPGGIGSDMPRFYQMLKKPLSGVFARNLFTEGDVKDMLTDAVEDESCIREEDIRQYYLPLKDGLTREAMMYAIRNYDLKGTLEDVKESDHEVLCVWGKEDLYHPVKTSVRFQSCLQFGRYYMMRNAGHLLQEEVPEQLIKLLLSYIPARADAR